MGRLASEPSLRVDRWIDLSTERVEYAEESAGKGSRALLHAARLLRDPDRYQAQFGGRAYDLQQAKPTASDEREA